MQRLGARHGLLKGRQRGALWPEALIRSSLGSPTPPPAGATGRQQQQQQVLRRLPALAARASAATEAATPAAASPSGSRPQRVCILVEPSPFTYVCGYMNRYRNTIRFLKEAGCEVMVVTPGRVSAGLSLSLSGCRRGGWGRGLSAWASPGGDGGPSSAPGAGAASPAPLTLTGVSPLSASAQGVSLPGADFSAGVDQPEDFHGAKVVSAFSFGCPWYWQLPLSFALSPRIYHEIKGFAPDVVHCSSPGVMSLAALLYSRLLRAPLVYSYHTHVPEYLPR